MRKIFILILLFSISISASSYDGMIFKKDNLSDFAAKTTKVVLGGDNSLLDLLLKKSIEENWTISPYEFCTMDEFDKIKRDTSLYFLIRVDGTHSKESNPSLEFLSLLKGSLAVEKGVEKMDEILSLPLQSINDPMGEVLPFLPAYVSIIQKHVEMITRNNLYAFSGFSAYTNMIDNAVDYTILFGKDDFDFSINQATLDDDFQGKALLVDSEQIEKALQERSPGKIVSLVIAPILSQRGSYCYKMLISTDSFQLYFYREHKIKGKNGKGFLKDDYLRISTPFSLR